MALFFVSFKTDLQPLLVDADDVAHATKIATDIAKEPPAKLKPIPAGVVVASLFTEPEDEDGDVLVIDPFDHVVDFLEKLDGELSEACGSEADADGGGVVTCELAPSHEGQHEGLTEEGELVRWAS